MDFFIELVAEALFGSAKESPEEMPEIEYKEAFFIQHPRKKILANICASLIGVAVFSHKASGIGVYIKYFNKVVKRCFSYHLYRQFL